MAERRIDLNLPVLTRVEGEGALRLRVKGNRIEQLEFRIYEPPRFFEKFLEGRHFSEVPDIVARICGICPVAYQVTAANALEAALAVAVDPWVREMRRLVYCGEWIQSHSLHIHLLALPDLFGCDSVITLAQKAPAAVRRGLRLQGLGNRLMRLLGGRSVHPVGLCIGGFHRAPARAVVAELCGALEDAIPQAEQLVAWLAELEQPDSLQAFTCVALQTERYAIEDGRLASSGGLDLAPADYPEHFTEFQQPFSTALWSHLNGQPYLVGPLARLNLGYRRLPDAVRDEVPDFARFFPSQNMFHSMLARGVEILWALREAVAILRRYDQPARCAVPVVSPPKAVAGAGWSEAPRGLLWQRYEVDPAGLITAARIVPPTSQNQARIAADLLHSLSTLGLHCEDSELRLHSERVIRNYDPCISCATHFLRLELERL